MITILGITLGAAAVFAGGVVLGWHIPMPPWAKWVYRQFGWKTAA